MSLLVHRIGPACSVQDLGRSGYLDQGLSRSGAADQLALHEGAALLGQDPALAAVEMAGFGGEFEATEDHVIALTGAPMQASMDGAQLSWNASHAVARGQRLSIGAAHRGVYGYLHIQGGCLPPELLGSRSAHLTAKLGQAIAQGDVLAARSGGARSGQKIGCEDRFSGGTLRVVPSIQSDLFSPRTRERFEHTVFTRGSRANRMGIQLDSTGDGFSASGQLNILSEVITPGDIQMTGAGLPFVLMPECQTTGGYPRIATVLPCDLPRAAQTPLGAELRFQFVTLEEADVLHAAFTSGLKRLSSRVLDLVRDPHDIHDLLSYQLISGMVSATSPEE